MPNVFLEGDLVYLRPLEEADLTEAYLLWLNDAEVSQFNSHAVFPNTLEKMRSYFFTVQTPQHTVFAIIHKDTNLHIGNVALQGIHWVNRSAEFAILLGNKQFWGKGIGAEVTRMMLGYGFGRLNLNRIHAGTLQGNEGMIRIFSKIGMRQEGRRVQAVYKNGDYVDVIEFGILRSEYKG